VLLEIGEARPHYQLIVEREHNLDTLTLMVEVDGQLFSDEIRKLEALSEKIRKNVESTLGVSVKVKLAEPKSIERSEGKAKRVIDKRKI
jgi:phenylacetate-CoA ligase